MTSMPKDLHPGLDRRVWERLGPILISRKTVETPLDIHEAIDRGFAIRPLKDQHWLMAFFERTVDSKDDSSKRSRKRLSSHSSGRLYQLAVVFEEALDVLGSEEAVIDFLDKPSIGLEQHKPIDLLTTPPGIQLVRTHIERMRFGVYC